ncbi:uncharacterized protein LOC115711386 [Cannabis sativa]|uniref:uncharacterized protein LOC115711386 n=1 Tax=Cannabis sativa TaxID=3483 RepID=UPI0029CAAB71|nr:uncharacterized protein LOC115711386 [Cannabis sativa]XP_060968178.1 uncharacterized protein LOC115711386 [Cannabis sativa]
MGNDEEGKSAKSEKNYPPANPEAFSTLCLHGETGQCFTGQQVRELCCVNEFPCMWDSDGDNDEEAILNSVCSLFDEGECSGANKSPEQDNVNDSTNKGEDRNGDDIEVGDKGGVDPSPKNSK